MEEKLELQWRTELFPWDKHMDVEKATQRRRVECSLTSVRKWEKEESQGSKGALVREVGKKPGAYRTTDAKLDKLFRFWAITAATDYVVLRLFFKIFIF